MSDNQPGPRRVKRLHNACEECRRRKIRCDSEVMPDNVCSSCLTLGIVCNRNKVYLKRGPKPGSTHTAVASQPVKVLVENILAGTPSEPFDVPGDKETTRKILTKLANRIQELEKELERVLETHAYFPKDQSSYANTPPKLVDHVDSPNSSIVQPEDASTVDELSKHLSQFSFGLPTHFGESSNLMLMVAALNHRAQLQGCNVPDWRVIFPYVKRLEFWNEHNWPVEYLTPDPPDSLEFPPRELMGQYIDAYFEEHEIYGPLLHRPTFEKQISEGLHLRDSAFSAVVLAVCALGAQTLSPVPSKDKSGERWFNQIRLERFVFSPKLELSHLQLYCLAIHYFGSLGAGIDLGWLLSGIAIRRSQEKGAHRRYTLNSQGPSIQGELWKRAFWQLVVIDSRFCTLFGRPRGTSILDFDLDPLVDCDDEYWEAQGSMKAFTQPPGKPSTVAYWNCYLRLIGIYGFAQLTIYAVRKSELGATMGIGNIEWYEKAVMELDSALNQWVDSVPDHLKWENQKDTSSVFFSQSAILHQLYYWVQIQVHRMFIPRPGQSSGVLSFPSLEICTNAARSAIRVCETHINKKSLLYPHFLISLFNSAIVLALNLVRSTQQKLNFDPGRELLDIYKCIELLHLYEARYPLSGRLVDTINMIMFASHYPLRPPLDPQTMPTQSTYTGTSEPGTTNPNNAPDTGGTASTFFSRPQAPTTSPSPWSETATNLPLYTSKLGELPVHGPNDNEDVSISMASGLSRSSPNNDSIFQVSNNDPVNTSILPTVNTVSGSLSTSPNTAGGPAASGAGDFIPTPMAAPGFMMPETWRSLFGEMRQPEQDWDTLLAGVDQLLNNGQFAGVGASMDGNGNGLSDFDPFNF